MHIAVVEKTSEQDISLNYSQEQLSPWKELAKSGIGQRTKTAMFFIA
jgi:predicted Zn-dependent protease